MLLYNSRARAADLAPDIAINGLATWILLAFIHTTITTILSF
jgi:hypothetical protein